MKEETTALLRRLADRYETAEFLEGDPSWFMHQARTDGDAELMGFVASCFSYGQRTQFMPRIGRIMAMSNGNFGGWIASGDYRESIADDSTCFYRLSTNADLRRLLDALRLLLGQYDSIGEFVRRHASDGLGAIKALTDYFAQAGTRQIVPQNAQSACKRLAMFLRWMVRDGSPVDLGLWHSFIDKRTLIMPLDTHVVEQSLRLGLAESHATTMKAAIRLTQTMREVFPSDPLRGDFALFGLGIDAGKSAKNSDKQF